MQRNIKFTIEQVAEMVGVSKSTLRKWEKVYGVHPDRNDGNHRRYRQGQVDVMLKIKALYDEGFALKGVKTRLVAELHRDQLHCSGSGSDREEP